MIYILVIYTILSFTTIYLSLRKYGISPIVVFLAMQFIMFVGIFFIINPKNKVDVEFLFLYLVSLLLFIIGSKFSELVLPRIKTKSKYYDINLTNLQKPIIIIILILSILVCSYFFTKTPNLLIVILSNIIEKQNINISDLRVASYSTIGIGYVYQFRVILLPFIVAYLLTDKNLILRLIGIISLPIMLVFILGTGQRGGFAIFSISWLVSLININLLEKNKKNLFYIILISIIFVFIFALLTIYNGRSSDSGGTLNAILQRIFIDNQNASIVAFRYVKTLPTQYGADWLNMFVDLLPGKNSYLPLANRVNALLYGGSTRGTAPPCIWTSSFYNWGYIGVLIFPITIGYYYQKLTTMYYNSSKTKINVYLFSFASIALGFWVADSPMALFNDGFISLLVLFLLMNYTILINENGKIRIRKRM